MKITIDEDKSNNRTDNLEWCDRKHNINHSNSCKENAYKLGIKRRIPIVINEQQYISISEAMVATGLSYKKIRKLYLPKEE